MCTSNGIEFFLLSNETKLGHTLDQHMLNLNLKALSDEGSTPKIDKRSMRRKRFAFGLIGLIYDDVLDGLFNFG